MVFLWRRFVLLFSFRCFFGLLGGRLLLKDLGLLFEDGGYEERLILVSDLGERIATGDI